MFTQTNNTASKREMEIAPATAKTAPFNSCNATASMADKANKSKAGTNTLPGEYNISLSQEQAMAEHDLKLLEEKQAADQKEE
jgi:hypothetical protein